MTTKIKCPTYEEILTYLNEYGWSYRDTTSDNGERVILTNLALDSEVGILISLHINEEFLLVSTVKLLLDIEPKYAEKLLAFNDILKLVKLYGFVYEDKLEAEIGFELWAGSWNKETFFSFLDMLSLGIEKTLDYLEEEDIGYNSQFIEYS